MALGPHVHREHPREEVVIVLPLPRELGCERRRRPRVHHVGICGEAARYVTLRLGVSRRHVGRRVDGELDLVGDDSVGVPRRSLRVERIPDGKRHAEVPLTADEPVAGEPFDPRLVACTHVLGMPGELTPSREQGVAEVRIASAVAEVPLA